MAYQRVGTALMNIAPASATSFTPTAATSFSSVTLTVTGSFGLQGATLYAKMVSNTLIPDPVLEHPSLTCDG